MRNLVLFFLAALAAFFFFLGGAFAAEPSFSATVTWSSNGASSTFKIDAAAVARVDKYDVAAKASWSSTSEGVRSFSLGVDAAPVERQYRCDDVRKRTFAEGEYARRSLSLRDSPCSLFGAMVDGMNIPRTFSEIALDAAEKSAINALSGGDDEDTGPKGQWRSIAPSNDAFRVFAPGSIAGAMEENDPASEIPRL